METQSIFIIGAGSSSEYGYPIWKELKVEIETQLKTSIKDGDAYSITAIEWLNEVTDEKTLDQVISEKNKSIKQAIDPSMVEAAIWTAIASIFFDLEKPIVKMETVGWLDIFVDNISNNVIQKYIATDKDWDKKIINELQNLLGGTYFITFNYDRILEYKIITTLTTILKKDVNNHNEFENRLFRKIREMFWNKIYHPHGIINPYPSINDNAKVEVKDRNSSNISAFGDGNMHQLKYAPGLMASCFDCEDDKGSFADLKSIKTAPKEIYILGNSPYGLQNNLKKLPCTEWGNSVGKIVCTSFNEEEQETYKKIINEAFAREIKIIFFKTCTDFINSEM